MSDRRADRKGLGRGLSALMGDVAPAPEASTPVPARSDSLVPIEDIAPNPDQPRRRFDEDALRDLARSIEEKGILQPVIVRPSPGGSPRYQIVAGERRWRAAQLARLHDVPVLVRDITDSEMMELAIVENIQRADLNPIEEAEGYHALMDRHARTQEEMAQALGKSRSHIANMLRLTQLPGQVQDMVRRGDLTAGHARALITADDPTGLAETIVKKGLSVRDAERLAKGPAAETTPKSAALAPEKDADTRALEGELSANLGMKVQIDTETGGGRGKLTVRFGSFEELDDLCRVLSATHGAGQV
ncbi:MAG: ParB/RepB/Spo0J family partition protein [Pseudomonadota bacterium]